MASFTYVVLIAVGITFVLAVHAEFPFIAFLQIPNPAHIFYNLPYCTGSILSATIVLTAARCIEEEVLKRYSVTVKIGPIDIGDPEGQTCSVAEFIRHPKYFYGKHSDGNIVYSNDIAVLKLADTIQFKWGIQTISLAAIDHNAEKIDGGKGIVAGWGAVDKYGRSSSRVLLYGYNYAVPLSNCEPIFKGIPSNDSICLKNEGTAPCYGDSGGPFIQTVEGKTVLVGVTSTGELPCGEYSTLYTRVNAYLDFITKYL